jgi:hypothetical protein
MPEKKISILAVSSVILSISSVFLWLTWIPGVICGHLARARIKTNPNLKGQWIALAGLTTGYFFPAALIAIVLYLSGYLEREIAFVDHGQIVWTGHFPHDANEKDSQNRADATLISVKVNGVVVGKVESRDKNLRLVFKPSGDKKEVTIWKYADYGEASKISVDEDNKSLTVYYDHTLIRGKEYITQVLLSDLSVHKKLINRGKWRI